MTNFTQCWAVLRASVFSFNKWEGFGWIISYLIVLEILASSNQCKTTSALSWVFSMRLDTAKMGFLGAGTGFKPIWGPQPQKRNVYFQSLAFLLTHKWAQETLRTTALNNSSLYTAQRYMLFGFLDPVLTCVSAVEGGARGASHATPEGCPRIQLSSDTIHLEIALDSTVKSLVLQDSPVPAPATSAKSHKSRLLPVLLNNWP